MPDDVPDYERWFLEFFGMSFEEGVSLLLRKASRLVCDADEARDLVHDFLVDELLPELRSWHDEED